jgi:hypothetical protein
LGGDAFGGDVFGGGAFGGDALGTAAFGKVFCTGGGSFLAFFACGGGAVCTARVVLPPGPLPFAFLPRVAMAGIMPVWSGD